MPPVCVSVWARASAASTQDGGAAICSVGASLAPAISTRTSWAVSPPPVSCRLTRHTASIDCPVASVCARSLSRVKSQRTVPAAAPAATPSPDSTSAPAKASRSAASSTAPPRGESVCSCARARTLSPASASVKASVPLSRRRAGVPEVTSSTTLPSASMATTDGASLLPVMVTATSWLALASVASESSLTRTRQVAVSVSPAARLFTSASARAKVQVTVPARAAAPTPSPARFRALSRAALIPASSARPDERVTPCSAALTRARSCVSASVKDSEPASRSVAPPEPSATAPLTSVAKITGRSFAPSIRTSMSCVACALAAPESSVTATR